MSGVRLSFNPGCEISEYTLADGSPLVVVDKALMEIESLRRFACERMAGLARDPRWHYPGPELPLDDLGVEDCRLFFRRQIRPLFGVSRSISEAYARLSMVTLRPEELSWRQRMCHTDGPGDLRGEAIIASVLYLFEDPALGGTAFYTRQPGMPDYLTLVRSGQPAPESCRMFPFFLAPPCYITTSNEFYKLDMVVSAKPNRMIFYRGDVPHSGYIDHPEKLCASPEAGRLTLNGFFRCRLF